MKRITLLAAAVAMTLAGSGAVAQHSKHQGYRGGHGGHNGGHYGGHRGGNGYSYGYGYGWAPRYSYPYSFYGSPYYVAPYYPLPVYAARPPVVVERYYVEPAPPPPPQYSREERSLAQITPPAPKRPAAPRFERVTLSAKELFAFDEATLRPPQPRLDEIAALMNKNPEIDRVRITGHTDRIGTESYNMKLSQRRAEAVKAYLVAKGVAAGRLAAVGKGEADPVIICNDTRQADLIKCLEPNRRVEVEEITIERRVS